MFWDPKNLISPCHITSWCRYPSQSRPVTLICVIVNYSASSERKVHLTNSLTWYSVLVTPGLKDVTINDSNSKEGMMPSGGAAFSSRRRVLTSSDLRILSSLPRSLGPLYPMPVEPLPLCPSFSLLWMLLRHSLPPHTLRSLTHIHRSPLVSKPIAGCIHSSRCYHTLTSCYYLKARTES